MERFSGVLLDVWKEACRHIEIDQSLSRMAKVLSRRLALTHVLIRRLDAGRRQVETVAAVVPQQCALAPRSDCSAADMERLAAWQDAGQALRMPAEEVRRRLHGLLPDGVSGDVLAVPLHASAGGVVVLALPEAASEPRHEALLQALVEPLSVALDNDRRLRELSSLREAAEADRRSLLSRLGRQDIGDTVVGAESGLREVMEKVALVARSEAPVLILGETGSGKEVVARAIHTRSGRARGPFLRVNCGAIPSGLIDSELFGHEKGSFTGAVGQHRGWFERADGGTLFLDEIGELSAAAQVRLLRVLQDGSFQRVGGREALSVDVRVVAATNRDLRRMAGTGEFREDLWYRIAVFPIYLPALRERLQDIPALASHFALRAATRLGLAPQLPTPQDLALLAAYPWPGNVRELASVMERAAILGNGQRLQVQAALGSGFAPAEPGAGAADALPPNAPFETLDAAVVRHVEAALLRCGGRIEGRYGAAQLLGINPHTLRARMRKLGIAWQRYRAGPPHRG